MQGRVLLGSRRRSPSRRDASRHRSMRSQGPRQRSLPRHRRRTASPRPRAATRRSAHVRVCGAPLLDSGDGGACNPRHACTSTSLPAPDDLARPRDGATRALAAVIPDHQAARLRVPFSAGGAHRCRCSCGHPPRSSCSRYGARYFAAILPGGTTWAFGDLRAEAVAAGDLRRQVYRLTVGQQHAVDHRVERLGLQPAPARAAIDCAATSACWEPTPPCLIGNSIASPAA